MTVQDLDRLSRRAGHHGPEALTFLPGTVTILEAEGFDVEAKDSRLRVRRDGRQYVGIAKYRGGHLIGMVYPLHHEGAVIVEIDLTALNATNKQSRTAHYDALLDPIKAAVGRLREYDDRQPL